MLIWAITGGGFVIPASAVQMSYLKDMKDALIAQGTDTAVLVLAYTLAPEAHYPTQLKEAVELLRHLIEVENRDPSNVHTTASRSHGIKLNICSDRSRRRLRRRQFNSRRLIPPLTSPRSHSGPHTTF